MSEINDSPKDIDNNDVQLTPSSTKKRMTRADRARIESEQLLKALGVVNVEPGRQTRSSTRGTTPMSPMSPMPKPSKRKINNTPRATKKSKANDQTDSINHAEEENGKNETMTKVESIEIDKDQECVNNEKLEMNATTKSNVVEIETDKSINETIEGEKTKETIETRRPSESNKSDDQLSESQDENGQTLPSNENVEATEAEKESPSTQNDTETIESNDSKDLQTVETIDQKSPENKSMKSPENVDDQVSIKSIEIDQSKSGDEVTDEKVTTTLAEANVTTA